MVIVKLPVVLHSYNKEVALKSLLHGRRLLIFNSYHLYMSINCEGISLQSSEV